MFPLKTYECNIEKLRHSTEDDAYAAYSRNMNYDDVAVDRGYSGKSYFLSVRCVQD